MGHASHDSPHSLVTRVRDVPGWCWQSRLKHFSPSRFQDGHDPLIKALEPRKVVECMCEDVVHLNPFRWMQMITTHWDSHCYRLSDYPRPLNLAASPCALRDDHQVGEQQAFRAR